jgi:hypothetical protein
MKTRGRAKTPAVPNAVQVKPGIYVAKASTSIFVSKAVTKKR